MEFVNDVKKNLRKNDVLIRLYSDTFLLFMPNTTKSEAEIAVSKIKNLNFEFLYAIADEGETLTETSKIAYDRLFK